MRRTGVGGATRGPPLPAGGAGARRPRWLRAALRGRKCQFVNLPRAARAPSLAGGDLAELRSQVVEKEGRDSDRRLCSAPVRPELEKREEWGQRGGRGGRAPVWRAKTPAVPFLPGAPDVPYTRI